MDTAMLLAAGEGRRMQPLTLSTPKPLLQVGGRCLIEWQLDRLSSAGIRRVIINVAYLGEQIVEKIGDGRAYGLDIDYSFEPEPLETGGAINQAIDRLGNQPFLLLNSDVWCDYPLASLVLIAGKVRGAHLVMVSNPSHHPTGDYVLSEGMLRPYAENALALTFSGLSVINPRVIQRYPRRRYKFPLKEVFDWLVEREQLSGEWFTGEWMDIGTPERLDFLNKQLSG